MKLLNSKMPLFVLAVMSAAAAAASAEVVVQAPTFTTNAGGAFDVPVRFTAAESSFPISGYYIDLRVTRLSGTGTLSLTGATPAANNPVGLTPMFFATPNSTPPGGNFNADSSSSTFAVADGTGLFSATYAITGTGTFGLSFITSGDPSNLYNAVTSAQVPPVTFSGGTITVVPEPASLALAAVGTAALLRRRRQ